LSFTIGVWGIPLHISTPGRDLVLLALFQRLVHGETVGSVVVMSSISIHSSPFNDTWMRIARMEWEAECHSLKDYDAGARRKVCRRAAHMLRESEAKDIYRRSANDG